MPQSRANHDEPIWVPRLLDVGLRREPDDLALVSPEGSLSWQELERASKRYSAGLLAYGLKPGDRIASLMPNSAALMIHYLGCFKSGIVAVPLNYRYTPPEIDHGLKTSGARALLAHVDRQEDIASSIARDLPLGVINYGSEHDRHSNFATLLESPIAPENLPMPAPTDPAVIFFTSGSTGPAKGVAHSFESLGSMIASFAQGCQTAADDIVLLSGSMSHIGALLDALMGLAAGARVVVPPSFDGPGLLLMLREHRPTILIALPSVLFGLVRAKNARREDFSSFRLLCAGGDKVPLELALEVTALSGLSVNELYGMSEIGVATINPPDGLNKAGSIGRQIVGYQISIRDDNGNELPPGAQGRLWINSPCNMVGYWGDADATRATIRDGWLDTGDVMKIDEDGYLWFCGRRKQIIVHDGSNISPQDVEEALMRHPAVAIAGVVGVPDTVHGENVHAFVTFKPGAAQPAPQELIHFARASVGYKAPESVFLLDEMPLSATDKVDRVVLKKLAERLLKSEASTG